MAYFQILKILDLKLFDCLFSLAIFARARAVFRFALLTTLTASILFAPPAMAVNMTFSVVPVHDGPACVKSCPEVIVATGEITDTTPDDFLHFLRQILPTGRIRPIVFLNSLGGKVIASMELGRAFRRLGMAAIVARVLPGEPENLTHFTGGECFSACVYALMGGKKRVIPPQSVVGLHRMFMVEPATGIFGLAGRPRMQFDDGEIAHLLRRYSQRMGVSPVVIDRAERMPPDYIHILSRAEISKWGLGGSRL